MKLIAVFIIALLLTAMPAGCTEKKPENTYNISPAVSASEMYSPTEPAKTPTYSESTASPSAAGPDETYAITDGPIPGLSGNQWYDFDKVGAYPGASVVQCGDRIAFQMIKEGKGILEFDCYLSFADFDGSHCVQTNIKNSSNPNYKDGWVYIIYKDDCIYKVKVNGSKAKEVFKAKSNLDGTNDVFLSDLLLVEDKIYVFKNIEYENKLKSILVTMNLDGSGEKEIDEFEHPLKDIEFVSRSDYSPSLFYDSGKLYYINTDPDNNKFDLYRYEIAANNKTCLIKSLTGDYEFKIAVRGDLVYFSSGGLMHTYTISTGKNKVFSPAENLGGFFDFKFFDRWLLMTGDGLYCYDLQTGKLYLADDYGITVDIVPTKNNVYIEEMEDYPTFWPVIFKNGEVTIGNCFNVRR